MGRTTQLVKYQLRWSQYRQGDLWYAILYDLHATTDTHGWLMGSLKKKRPTYWRFQQSPVLPSLLLVETKQNKTVKGIDFTTNIKDIIKYKIKINAYRFISIQVPFRKYEKHFIQNKNSAVALYFLLFKEFNWICYTIYLKFKYISRILLK